MSQDPVKMDTTSDSGETSVGQAPPQNKASLSDAKKAQLEAARARKAQKAAQREQELSDLKSKLSSLETKAVEIESRSAKVEERLTNSEVQKDVNSDPSPKVVTQSEPAKKRKADSDNTSLWGDFLSVDNVLRVGALAGLGVASHYVRNWKRPAPSVPAPPPQPSQPAATPQPQPGAPRRQEPPYTRPMRVESSRSFI